MQFKCFKCYKQSVLIIKLRLMCLWLKISVQNQVTNIFVLF